MEDVVNVTVGEIVAKDYRFASVFESFGIDFCCNGDVPLTEVCKNLGLSLEEVDRKLEDVRKTKESKLEDFDSWPIDLLATYIQKKHHAFVEEKIPLINAYLAKLCDVHGGSHPELFDIAELFKKSGGDLTVHMKKEELILFPFINKMVKIKEGSLSFEKPIFGSVKNAIDAMHHDHEDEGERFRQISKLSKGYKAPEDGCGTYRAAFAELEAFEKDLHLHIHLENNILFPKSILMEQELSLN